MENKMKISEAFEQFLIFYLEARMYSRDTIKGHRTVMRAFVESVEDIYLDEIKSEHVIRWTATMNQRGNSPATIVSHLSRFKVFINFCIEAGWCPLIRKDEIHVPKKPRTIPRYVTPDSVDKIIRVTADVRDKALIAFAFSTGARNSEIRNLLRNDIDGFNVRINQGKGQRDRMTYMDQRAKLYLDWYLETRIDTCPYLFTTSRLEQIGKSTLRYIFAHNGQRAGLGHISPHMFRHGAATHLMNKGMPSRYIQKFLGHSFLSTTEQYMHVSDTDLQTQHSRIMSARNEFKH